mmetsp:Transcript_18189/g.39780  ORF Transcript_18189/g.39780 Transcript_18189/m.39780 type:complete len:124 (-) Transcript_18189:267-638(-)
MSRPYLFCSMCGNLLSVDVAEGAFVCDMCQNQRTFEELDSVEVHAPSGPEDLLVRHNLEQAAMWVGSEAVSDKMRQHALVDEKCPKCNHPQLEYYTMQLRSADEGQTVFYECPKCKHKFSVNN